MEIFGNSVFFIVLCLIGAIPLILFIRSIQNTLNLISPHNRKIKPSLIWLTLIPLPVLSNIWLFVLVTLVANSLALEYTERNIPYKSKPTFIIGITMSVISCLAYFSPFKKYTGILWFIFFFAYWAQIVRSKRDLIETQSKKISSPDFSNGM